ncbi:hypothetical protein [Hydrogenivirga sp. 128-5-R1-1]|uniref:hypothetical protein n=1 Tax=Hydrogenivirga sp. 128-5-R1-1 TaxID=392423 RepID=UPI00015EF711|nr:hypothetical protein [Hydrogenivirga sp. 128-5-R1-1]EDP74381.1 hypothetical protein HG1285_12927 [Hydrogenivirga sp. 128-5-R1-1]EDP74407.1 hypothetical protein HG1285_12912 [Hydrogenivirga sp. 128-5-R1-1]
MAFLGDIGKFFFGSGEKTTVIPPQILKRSPEQSAFASYFLNPVVMGLDVKFEKNPITGEISYKVEPNFDKLARMEKARDNYVSAMDNYGQTIQGILSKLKSYNPIVSTPFGNIQAFGLQRAALNNAGLLANFAKEAITAPKKTAFDVYYQQPLDIFLKQDLARYGIKGDTIYKPRDYGLLPSLIAAGGSILAGKAMQTGSIF